MHQCFSYSEKNYQVSIQFTIEGDITEQQKQEILQLGPRFSPVFDIVSNKAPVSVKLAGNQTFLLKYHQQTSDDPLPVQNCYT